MFKLSGGASLASVRSCTANRLLSDNMRCIGDIVDFGIGMYQHIPLTRCRQEIREMIDVQISLDIALIYRCTISGYRILIFSRLCIVRRSLHIVLKCSKTGSGDSHLT